MGIFLFCVYSAVLSLYRISYGYRQVKWYSRKIMWSDKATTYGSLFIETVSVFLRLVLLKSSLLLAQGGLKR